MQTQNKNRAKRTQPGFTLVEILVVLVIATVVISIAIPRIRSINKERNIREAARVVGSMFATASQRASVEGIAGVHITRNTNFELGGFQFAATEMSLLRKVPNYTGDTQDAELQAVDDAGGTVTIFEPLEQDELEIIREGDSISFNSSSVRYYITNVRDNGNQLVLTLDRGEDDYMPMPPDESSFVVYRLPRVLRSSVATLPNNYIVDLRFSGFEVMDMGDATVIPAIPAQRTRVFEPVLGDMVAPAGRAYDIDIIFDEEGAVDRVFYSENGETVTRQPLGSLYFYVIESPDSLSMDDEVASADETGLWVAVSNLTGMTNIGYNNSGPSSGFSYQGLTDYYNAAADTDEIPSMDRDEFNQIISNSRNNSLSASAAQ